MQSRTIPDWSNTYNGSNYYQNNSPYPGAGQDYTPAITGISPSTFIGSSPARISTNPVNLAGSRQHIISDTFPKTRYPITSSVYPSYPNYSKSPRYNRTSWRAPTNAERYANAYNPVIYSQGNYPSVLTTDDPNQAFSNFIDTTPQQGSYAFIASIANTNKPFIGARGGFYGQNIQIPDITDQFNCGYEKVSGLYNC
jgi:hypothetical protein